MPGKKPFDLYSLEKRYRNLSDKAPFAGDFGWHRAGAGSQFDMHYGLEFGIVLNGGMKLVFFDAEIHLSAGNVWFCGMWEPHSWSAGSSYEKITILIWPPALASLRFDEAAHFDWLAPFTMPPTQRPQTNVQTRRAMLEIGDKIKNCLKTGGDNRNLWLRLYVMEAILLTAHQLSESGTPARESAGSGEKLNKVLKYFLDNRGLMTTKDAATMCGMNRNAFSRMFARLMGLPFAEFALRYRLNSAASFLRRTDELIKSVSLIWGFADTSHFDRLFARYYGCSPREYRQSRK